MALAAVLTVAPAVAQHLERLPVPIIETVAGTGVSGFSGDGGPATAARFGIVNSVDVDAEGNLYIADYGNRRVRRVDAATGIITTVAGRGGSAETGDGGLATDAQFAYMLDVRVDRSGNLYISGSRAHRIRRVDAATGIITTYAGTGTAGYSGDGGLATAAQVNRSYGLALDHQDNLYFADADNHRVRRVDAATGIITTFAGTGTAGSSGNGGLATAAQLNNPLALEFDGHGNLYISELGSRGVRKVDAATGIITAFAGTGVRGGGGDGGPALQAQFSRPDSLNMDAEGNLFINDYDHDVIRKVDAVTGIITRFAGTGTGGYNGDGIPAAEAQLNDPYDGALDPIGNLYTVDDRNRRIRLIRRFRVFTPNAAPVAVGEIEDLELDVGESARVTLGGLFQDATPLTYSASSSNPAAAGARVAAGAVELEGLAAGLATVTVTATDPGGLSATLSFRVMVGQVLSFEDAAAEAPEGGVLRWRLHLSGAPDAPVPFAWRAVADRDPATADADAADLAALEGTGEVAAGASEAFIAMPVLDDGEAEPLRERLVVELLAPAAGADHVLGVASALAIVQEGVCDRDPAVRDELRRGRPCEAVDDLSRWTALRLAGAGLERLRAADLLGLERLALLDLSDNGLTAWPSDALAALPLLLSLNLDGNRVTSLPETLGAHGQLRELRLSRNALAAWPAGALRGLEALERLHLSDNELAALPADAFDGMAGLKSLRLDGNALRELPAGLFLGLGQLAELQLQGNPGAPFTFTAELARADAEPWAPGPAAVAMRLDAAAPFTLQATLAAPEAALPDGGALQVPAGQALGQPVAVAQTDAPAVVAQLAAAPAVPDVECRHGPARYRPCFQGIATAAGEPLVLFKPPPAATAAVPEQALDPDKALRLDLTAAFGPVAGDVLTFAAESSAPTVARARVVDGGLVVEAWGEGVATVTVTATDAYGQTGTLAFTVQATPLARGRWSGWRLILMEP